MKIGELVYHNPVFLVAALVKVDTEGYKKIE